ncbi:hypothetical protein [Gemmatimonas sp.]|uniref:hypothetical protein n=1 Tax=Gemmatimonas sp. TaxID=1962908 RepID=UPI0039839CA5
MDSSSIGIIFVIALFAVGFRLLADRWDRDRIQQYVAERGGAVNDITWQPFGRGWFGEKGDRIYEVEYTDRDGASPSASCKTSLFSGVYSYRRPHHLRCATTGDYARRPRDRLTGTRKSAGAHRDRAA